MADDDQIPVPDPTVRTEERLLREIGSLKESFSKDIECIKEVQIEKFQGIERELTNLANRTAEQKTDVKEAVNSALSAAKELVALQNTNTLEALRALGLLIQTQGKADTEILSDLKDRVVRIESVKAGATEAVTSSRDTQANIRATILAVAVVLSTIIGVVGFAIANKP